MGSISASQIPPLQAEYFMTKFPEGANNRQKQFPLWRRNRFASRQKIICPYERRSATDEDISRACLSISDEKARTGKVMLMGGSEREFELSC